MATYVLVPGGGHGGWCYKRVARLLRGAGHDVYTPTLTGIGERSHLLHPAIGLDTQIDDVVQLLTYEDLHEVILAGHSYGGMVITGVADRAVDRIGWLVYLDAARPRNGESLADRAPELMAMAKSELQIVDGVEVVLGPESQTNPHLGVTDPAQLRWMTPKLTPHPWKCFTQPIRLANEPAVWQLPRAAINCSPTMQMRGPDARAEALDADRIFEIDTGHDLMITEPEQLAKMLLELATP
jgi:pimeloyl-ACP methyl ester carboxylesterase